LNSYNVFHIQTPSRINKELHCYRKTRPVSATNVDTIGICSTARSVNI